MDRDKKPFRPPLRDGCDYLFFQQTPRTNLRLRNLRGAVWPNLPVTRNGMNVTTARFSHLSIIWQPNEWVFRICLTRSMRLKTSARAFLTERCPPRGFLQIPSSLSSKRIKPAIGLQSPRWSENHRRCLARQL